MSQADTCTGTHTEEEKLTQIKKERFRSYSRFCALGRVEQVGSETAEGKAEPEWERAE